MKLAAPALRSAVAAEYALGNLGARARCRFERLLADDAALRAELASWRLRLDTAAAPECVAPPPEVWLRINRTLDALEIPAHRPAELASRHRLRRHVRLWQACAGLASAAAAVFAALLLNAPSTVSTDAQSAITTASAGAQPSHFWRTHAAARAVPAGYAATLQLPLETSARWRISLSPDGRLLRVQSVGYPMLEADQDYELWWVGENDIIPVGLLPRNGSWMLSLPREVQMTSASRLVITREPALGSPADGPTGPVLMNTALRPLA